MSPLVKAWRGRTGACGITIGSLTAGFEDNWVSELTLDSEAEVEEFIGQIRAAWKRAQNASEPFHEEMPGPYADEWHES